MSTVFNTSYKIQADVDTDAIRNQYNIEEGAYVTTESGVWTVSGGEWVKLYPQAGVGTGIGWARYDDGQYTSESKLSLTDGVIVVLPNNGANVVRSESGLDFYNPTTRKILASAMNDVYVLTIVFKGSAANANQTYLTIEMDNINGTEYSRLSEDLSFPRGNDAEHNFHSVFQYYVDADFVSNGATWRIKATGGSAQIWDIIYFIQKTQSYA